MIDKYINYLKKVHESTDYSVQYPAVEMYVVGQELGLPDSETKKIVIKLIEDHYLINSTLTSVVLTEKGKSELKFL